MLEDLIKDDNILGIYPFGSRIYKTDNQYSDYDYICIVNDKKDSLLTDESGNHFHFYTKSEFIYSLNDCDIQILECYFLDDSKIIKKPDIEFKLDLNKYNLRKSISTISSNSFVKGKKKLIISGDYDKNIAIKSVFHSLRILNFGIQIVSDGKIYDYSSMNWLFIELNKLAESYDRNELWEIIETRYKKVFNEYSSMFKSLCPKDLTEIDKKNHLKSILNKYGIDNTELFNELLQYI